MKKITKAWLVKKNACTPSLRFAESNNWIGLDIYKSLDLLIWANRLNDANWLITRTMNKKQCVEYAIYAAEQVLNIFEKKYHNDSRPRIAIAAAKSYLETPCRKTKKEAYAAYAAYAAYDAAADAAYAAAYAAYAAYDAAADAAYAAYDAAADAAYAADDFKLKIILNGIKILKNWETKQS